jgi:hypothetical protein
MTAQGHPRAIFKRAVERGNLVLAEATARELGRITLDQALRLLFLYAEKQPINFERAALRWLGRYVTEGKAVSLLKAQSSRLRPFRAASRQSGSCGEAPYGTGAVPPTLSLRLTCLATGLRDPGRAVSV